MLMMVAAVAGCGAKNDTAETVETEVGRRAVPYTRRTVTTVPSTPGSLKDYRERLLEGSGIGAPDPPEVFGATTRSTARASSTTTTRSPGASPSSSVLGPPTPGACKQYGQLLQLVDDMLKLVDVNDPAATAAAMAPVVSASRDGLQQLVDSPYPEVAGETVAIVNWLSNKARNGVTDDAGFETAVNSLRGWYAAKC